MLTAAFIALRSAHDSAGWMGDLGDMFARWIAHAAVWRLVSALSLPILLIVLAATAGWMVYRRRKGGQRR